ncbi:ABC transporter related protein [alpha proteobacterium BAL199]|jgi:sn-glycerol 3-phosphate transport system ATP-binding protein|nr:ABC transporter related protein [alpha proteobacterium BAL199]
MANLQISGVEKVYPNGFKAIHGIDLKVEDGEFIVLVGPSGCGKSTLLRMIAGLETVTGGTIQIGDRVVNDLEPADRDIAMVFQNYALYPHMSVYQNMSYGLRNRGFPKAAIEERVQKAASILQLDGLLDRRPRQLSGGQRQRVAMGRAIVREPAAFLFDEPLSNLDAKLRVQMRVEIKQLQRRLGTTSVYVTHDQIEAMTMADRLVVMNAGVAEQIGTPIDLYEKPSSVFVGGFIGSPAMNFMPGQVEADGRHLTLADGSRLVLPADGRTVEPGRSVTIGVRPEHLMPSSDTDSALKFEIVLVEHLGADTLLYGLASAVQGAGEGGLLTVRMSGHHVMPAGTVIPLVADPSHLHLFDVATGRRI